MDSEMRERIEINPGIIAGKPVIKGTRVPVDMIIRLVAQGMSFDEVLEDYPRLNREDIQAALLYGSEVVAK